MSPIPIKLREELSQDPYYSRCARKFDGNCSGRITWEHAFEYQGRQIQERWSILPLCWHHHLGEGLDKDKNHWIALHRATVDDFQRHPRKKWYHIMAYLNNKYINAEEYID